jgi:hypothetical protein
MWTLKPEQSPSDIMTTVCTTPVFYSIFLDFFSIFSDFMRTRKRPSQNLYTFVWLWSKSSVGKRRHSIWASSTNKHILPQPPPPPSTTSTPRCLLAAIASSPPPHRHHIGHLLPPSTSVAHNHHTTDDVATPRHQPNERRRCRQNDVDTPRHRNDAARGRCSTSTVPSGRAASSDGDDVPNVVTNHDTTPRNNHHTCDRTPPQASASDVDTTQRGGRHVTECDMASTR